MKKKVLSIVLAIMMVLSVMPLAAFSAFAADAQPVATWEKIEVPELDYAVKYSYVNAGANSYQDWDVDFTVSANKDVKAGAVQVAGQYGTYPLTFFEGFEMEAGKEYKVIETATKGKQHLVYAELLELIKTSESFICGIKDIDLEADTEFTINISLSKEGEDDVIVEGGEVEKILYVKPEAKCEEITVAGLDKALKYTIEKPASEYYDDWNAYIFVTPDQDVPAGAVTLSGKYGTYDWTDMDSFAMTKDEPVNLLAKLPNSPAVSYSELAKIQPFYCGIKNNALDKEVKFTVDIVLAKGDEHFTVKGSEVAESLTSRIEPVAKCEEITYPGLDKALKYTIDTPASAYFNDWNAYIYITPAQDVPAGAVTLAGQYGTYGLTEMESFAMAKDENVDLLAKLPDSPTVSYAELKDIQPFICGIINNSDTEYTFTTGIVLSNGVETLKVEGAEKTETVGAKVDPVASVTDTTVDGLDKAAIYDIATPASACYNDWNADIVISADKDVAEGDIILAGQYGTYPLTELAPFAMAKDEEISLLAKFGYEAVTYADLVAAVAPFTFGYKNVDLDADTTFTVKVVLSKEGEEPLTVTGSTYPVEVKAVDKLAAYKAAAIEKIDKFIAENVPAETQSYAPFTSKVAELKDAINKSTSEGEIDEKLAQALKVIEDKYVPETYTVNVAGGASVTSQKLTPAKSTKYEIATVKIKEANGINEDGKWFVYWVDENNRIVSTYSTYSFFVVKETTLTPVYVDKKEYAAERDNGIIVTDIVRAEDNGDGTASFFSERSASKAAVGDKITQHGIIWTTDEAQKNSLTIDNNENVNVNPAAKTGTSLTGMYKLNVSANEGDTVYAVSYLIDAEGNTYYGDVQAVTITNGSTSSAISCEVIETVLTQADEIIHTVTETEPEAESAPTFVSVLMNIINAVATLIQSIIALF